MSLNAIAWRSIVRLAQRRRPVRRPGSRRQRRAPGQMHSGLEFLALALGCLMLGAVASVLVIEWSNAWYIVTP
jgi:acyl-CoA synthetase (AMP-forming)/AMP-acid ligase II